MASAHGPAETGPSLSFGLKNGAPLESSAKPPACRNVHINEQRGFGYLPQRVFKATVTSFTPSGSTSVEQEVVEVTLASILPLKAWISGEEEEPSAATDADLTASNAIQLTATAKATAPVLLIRTVSKGREDFDDSQMCIYTAESVKSVGFDGTTLQICKRSRNAAPHAADVPLMLVAEGGEGPEWQANADACARSFQHFWAAMAAKIHKRAAAAAMREQADAEVRQQLSKGPASLPTAGVPAPATDSAPTVEHPASGSAGPTAAPTTRGRSPTAKSVASSKRSGSTSSSSSSSGGDRFAALPTSPRTATADGAAASASVSGEGGDGKKPSSRRRGTLRSSDKDARQGLSRKEFRQRLLGNDLEFLPPEFAERVRKARADAMARLNNGAASSSPAPAAQAAADCSLVPAAGGEANAADAGVVAMRSPPAVEVQATQAAAGPGRQLPEQQPSRGTGPYQQQYAARQQPQLQQQPVLQTYRGAVAGGASHSSPAPHHNAHRVVPDRDRVLFGYSAGAEAPPAHRDHRSDDHVHRTGGLPQQQQQQHDHQQRLPVDCARRPSAAPAHYHSQQQAGSFIGGGNASVSSRRHSHAPQVVPNNSNSINGGNQQQYASGRYQHSPSHHHPTQSQQRYNDDHARAVPGQGDRHYSHQNGHRDTGDDHDHARAPTSPSTSGDQHHHRSSGQGYDLHQDRRQQHQYQPSSSSSGHDQVQQQSGDFNSRGSRVARLGTEHQAPVLVVSAPEYHPDQASGAAAPSYPQQQQQAAAAVDPSIQAHISAAFAAGVAAMTQQLQQQQQQQSPQAAVNDAAAASTAPSSPHAMPMVATCRPMPMHAMMASMAPASPQTAHAHAGYWVPQGMAADFEQQQQQLLQQQYQQQAAMHSFQMPMSTTGQAMQYMAQPQLMAASQMGYMMQMPMASAGMMMPMHHMQQQQPQVQMAPTATGQQQQIVMMAPMQMATQMHLPAAAVDSSVQQSQ